MAKNEYREIWAVDPTERQLREAGAEANRVTQLALTDMRPTPNRISASSAVAFGQLVLADTLKNDIGIMLPSATQDDVGRTVTIKLWSGSPTGTITITAPLDGRIDGNASWTLNYAMQGVTIAYAGFNAWVIVSQVSGVGTAIP